MNDLSNDDPVGTDRRAPLTQLIHHPYRPPGGFEAVQGPVHKASTVIFPTVQALRARHGQERTGYSYGLHGTPTTYTLEERIACLEGGRHTLLAPSGLSALALVDLALLSQGDTVLLPDNVYGPSKDLAQGLLAQWGIQHRFYDPMDLAELQSLLRTSSGSGSVLLWMEAPGSVTMEFPDVREAVRLARERGARVALDNTWGAGLAFNPFDLGEGLAVDISMHALTKFPSGGADVLMGAVTTVQGDLHQRLVAAHRRLGLGVAANDAELVLRSLHTIELRYDAQDASARCLASWLSLQPEVSRVLHPALPGSPGHQHWANLCQRAAGLFSFLLDPRFPSSAVDSFVNTLELFKLGYSWGGPVSLVVPYDLSSMRRRVDHLPGHLIRLSIGLESTADLQNDLARALQVLRDAAPAER